MLLATLAATTHVYADEQNGIEYSGSGFATFGLGKILGGAQGVVQDYNCPCFVTDFTQGGIYEGNNDVKWKPNTKIGVQGGVSFANRKFSVTGQLVSRGAQDGAVDLEWLYASYKLNDNVTLNAGRKRIPMFYYSDAQDVGVALPWTHLPSLYGWEAVNYNGVDLTYQRQVYDWSASGNVFAGNESVNDSAYWKTFLNGRQSRTDVKWNNIVGGNVTLAKDWFETRLTYIQSKTQQTYQDVVWNSSTATYDPASGAVYADAKQRIYGLAMNADYQNWLARTEFINIKHVGLGFDEFAQIVAAGYHYQKWQPMVTWSRYKGVATDPNLPGYAPDNSQEVLTMTLRYDLTTSSDLKLQLDGLREHHAPYLGNARLLSFTYDKVF